ncbi:hypothetical protein [Streptomyces dubilierae]|uniref:Uncharacterized protein n=1 Tax=Streptomyces dubilierae TaxID=3075533 RepID=A0ABU2P1N3_9ACTN|nr:hypothetical protein [Streptomyces sp. DSM 41921]MDT0386038.1 hypothetical protein [Streptomyces sp. DSM 41921]
MTGLFCPPAASTCRASRLELQEPTLIYPGKQGNTCATAQRLTLTRGIRFKADRLRGTVLGIVPLTMSTRTIPALPLPYLMLTDVEARGVWARAEQIEGPAMLLGTADSCHPSADNDPRDRVNEADVVD